MKINMGEALSIFVTLHNGICAKNGDPQDPVAPAKYNITGKARLACMVNIDALRPLAARYEEERTVLFRKFLPDFKPGTAFKINDPEAQKAINDGATELASVECSPRLVKIHVDELKLDDNPGISMEMLQSIRKILIGLPEADAEDAEPQAETPAAPEPEPDVTEALPPTTGNGTTKPAPRHKPRERAASQ